MAESSIPVDLFNPGQVFACIGLLEAALSLVGDAEAAFDWSDPARTRFALRVDGTIEPIAQVIDFLASSTVTALAPHGSPFVHQWLASWGPVRALDRVASYPFAGPASPATLAAELRPPGHPLALGLDYWGDSTHRRDAVKFWGGARGYPGAALARDALALVGGRWAGAAANPFALASPQTSSFRLDWRRDYIPIDAGFSLNAHGNMETVGYPLVELLGAIGLTNARPARVDWRDKLHYRYAVVGRSDASGVPAWYPPSFLRAALGDASLGAFPTRRFHMSLGSPGQEGKDRSITTVKEETA